eukprot:TRINITY_DN27756_c0_g2_i1.p1 TRINITY_DN27756_c0_g2~~TRINITY_DN27756_c0_g2_i1.p1  ORF type:complete len:387 (-),score=60.73 TRINITY_DN27756_c0_g2_i1:171-1331(-)
MSDGAMQPELQAADAALVAVCIIAWIGCAFTINMEELCRFLKSLFQSMCSSSSIAPAPANDALAEWCWAFICQANSAFCCVFFVGTVRIVVWRTMSPEAITSSPAQDWMIAVTFLGVVAFRACSNYMRRALGPWVGSHVYYTVTSMVLCSTVLSSSKNELLSSDFIVLPLRVALSLLPLRKSCVVLVNLLWCGMVIRSYMLAGTGVFGPIFTRMPIVNIVFSVFFINLRTVIQVRLMAEDEATSRVAVMFEAAMRLLDLLCDAVVELGADLCLIADSPKMAGMLFLSGKTNLKELEFGNLLSEEDRLHFNDVLGGVAAGHGPDVGALNLALNDSMGNKLHLEAFYIHIAGGAGKTRYLLGLRESIHMEGRVGALPELGYDGESDLA